MAYPTATAIVAASSGDARAALDALDTAQLASLRDSAIVAVEEYARQSFAGASTATKVLDGHGTDRLDLPEHLEALTAASVDGVSLGIDEFALDEAGSFLTILARGGGNAYTRLMGTLDPDWDPARRGFTLGRGTVSLTGTWGWTTCPTNVALALRFDMEDNALADSHALAASIHAYRALGLRDIRQGNLSATVQDTPGISARVARMLRPYVWQPAARSV